MKVSSRPVQAAIPQQTLKITACDLGRNYPQKRPSLPLKRTSLQKRASLAPQRRAVLCLAFKTNRAVVILPGLGNNQSDYNNLADQLKSNYNLHVEIAPVARIDWARNAAGLLDSNYWRGTLNPRPTVDWYLNKIQFAVDNAKSELGADGKITLLAHSAGGWLGRLYMLDFDISNIDRFVSLGSPHNPPPPGVIDQTRGILTWISQNTPGAYHTEVQYVSIAGRYLKGASFNAGDATWQQKIVGAGYQQVAGSADVDGDGITPVVTSHLDGALQITLDGVYHSPLGAEEGSDEKESLTEAGAVKAAAAEDSTILSSDDYEFGLQEIEEAAAAVYKPGPRVWYGSTKILPLWADLLITNP